MQTSAVIGVGTATIGALALLLEGVVPRGLRARAPRPFADAHHRRFVVMPDGAFALPAPDEE